MAASPPSLQGLTAEQAACGVAKELDALRAESVEVLDVQHILPITTCFVLATGSSSRAIKNLADTAERLLRSSDFEKIGVESDEEGRWICVDYTEIVVHVFDDDARRFYAMDQLWADAKRIPIPD